MSTESDRAWGDLGLLFWYRIRASDNLLMYTPDELLDKGIPTQTQRFSQRLAYPRRQFANFLGECLQALSTLTHRAKALPQV